jgi:hypothetical protein
MQSVNTDGHENSQEIRCVHWLKEHGTFWGMHEHRKFLAFNFIDVDFKEFDIESQLNRLTI